MTLAELVEKVYDSNIEPEAKAELSDIVAAYKRIKKEPWHPDGCGCKRCKDPEHIALKSLTDAAMASAIRDSKEGRG